MNVIEKTGAAHAAIPDAVIWLKEFANRLGRSLGQPTHYSVAYPATEPMNELAKLNAIHDVIAKLEAK